MFQVKSQNISIREDKTKNKVKTIVNEKGDTLVQLPYKDAKLILIDLLECRYNDSLLITYIIRDSLKNDAINIQKDIIVKLENKNDNLEVIIDNLTKVIENKDAVIGFKAKIIEDQKKEIRKQKTYKIIGITGAIVLPILVLIYGG